MISSGKINKNEKKKTFSKNGLTNQKVAKKRMNKCQVKHKVGNKYDLL